MTHYGGAGFFNNSVNQKRMSNGSNALTNHHFMYGAGNGMPLAALQENQMNFQDNHGGPSGAGPWRPTKFAVTSDGFYNDPNSKKKNSEK